MRKLSQAMHVYDLVFAVLKMADGFLLKFFTVFAVALIIELGLSDATSWACGCLELIMTVVKHKKKLEG